MPHVISPQSYCRAGAARADITPPIGAYHRMWGAASHDQSTGVHRPLNAIVLALRPTESSQPVGGNNGAVLVNLDHCILGDIDLDNIRRQVAEATTFAPEQVRISLTHTHGAGLMMRDRAGLPGGDKIIPYLEEMAQRIAAAACEAEKNLQPAWIVSGTGRCQLAAHRDFFDEARGGFVCGFNPGGPADDTLLVARVTDEVGRPMATIVNYACHPTTLAWQNTRVSPDFVGAMRECVERETGGAPCLFLQGASAELGPREGFVGDVAIADRNGRQLGHAALAAMESLSPPGSRFEYTGAVISGAVLGTWAYVALDAREAAAAAQWRCRSWTIDLPYRSDQPSLQETQAEREQLSHELENAQQRGDPAAAQDLRAKVEQKTRQIMRLEALPPGKAYPLAVTILQVGGAIWVFVAGELYSELQTTLRRRFPAIPIFVATISDGWQPGYIPPADVYGRGIYQEIIAMVAPGSLQRVIDDVGGQIERWSHDIEFKATNR